MERDQIVTLENWVDEAVMGFVVDMKYKLRLNNHKGHWKDYDMAWLVKRTKDEVKELGDALQQVYDKKPNAAMYMDVIHECADVSNFVMMIADNIKRRMRENATQG